MSWQSSTRTRQAPPVQPTPLPAQVAEWARTRLGTITPWLLPADFSGARSWRVSAPQGLIDIRVTRHDLDFRREVQAYRVAIHRLGPANGPRLIASEARLRALLITHPRGRPVDGEVSLHVLPRVHEDAGRLLAVLHRSVERVPDAAALGVRHLAHYIQRILYLLERIDSWLSPEEAEVIRRSTDRLLHRSEELPVAFCHGTFATSSWRWNIQGQTLSLTDLGRAQVLPAVCDFTRTAALWATHAHLAEAFFAAYGRKLSDAEQLVLDDAAIVAAVEDLHRAIASRDGDTLSSAGAALREAMRHRPSIGRHEESA